MSVGSAYSFCPYDGTPLATATREGVQRVCCPACSFVDYQNPKPGVAVLVERDGKLLLARRAAEPCKGMWDIPGGFIDAGESAERAVAREIQEETGLVVSNVQYLGSYPDVYGERREPIVSFCFIAATSGTPQAASDVSELRWFAPDEIPTELAFPHEYDIIRDWRARRDERR